MTGTWMGLALVLILALAGGAGYILRRDRISRHQLVEAIESIPEAFTLYDRNDRLVLWNSHTALLFPGQVDFMRAGVGFDFLVRRAVEKGDILDAVGREEAWLAQRMIRHRDPAGAFEIRLKSGRVVEVHERRTRDGGVVATYVDVTERVRALETLARHENELNRAQHLARFGSWTWDRKSDGFAWSPQLYRIFGVDPAEFTPTLEAILELVHPSDRERVKADLQRGIANLGIHTLNFRIIRPDGTVCHLKMVRECLADAKGESCLVTGVAQDVTEKMRAEQHLERLFQAVEQSPDSVVITDPDGTIEYVNPAFFEITGYSAAEVLGRNPRVLKSGYTPVSTYRDLWRTIASGRTWRGELHNRRKNGEFYWEDVTISPVVGEDGNITHYIGIKQDISMRKRYEEQLLRQANYDELTDLPNRVLAFDRLTQALARAERERHVVALMIVNIDELKKINNSLGHAAGDQVLVEISRRMASCVRDGDTVARIEGDQFMVILPDLGFSVFAEVVAQKILTICTVPIGLHGNEVSISARIGLTLYPSDGADPYVLLRNAHAAVNRAKEIGGNAYRFFTPKMNEGAVRRLAEENLLRHAIDRNEMSLVFQPLVDAESGRPVLAEALLRWNNPELGPVPPDQFIPTAEKSGLIIPIGEWVLDNACRAAAQWKERTGQNLSIAVNVSFRQFKGGGLTDTVARALETSGLPASLLELEITERVLIDDAPETGVILNTLSEMGVKLAMDDFGTGYSSLSYLKRFPFDTIKVDRSFVRDVIDDPEDAALATAIITMGRSLGLKVVAEGVETEEQLVFLRERGCHLVQGYYLSRPLSPAAFEEYLNGFA